MQMLLSSHLSPRNVPAPFAPPPRWAIVTAYIAILVTLPSSLWRIALAIGIPVGMSPEWLVSMHVPGRGTLTILALSLVQECAALLILGLVQSWGEVVPPWFPFVGGKIVHPLVALVPATLGTIVLTVLFTLILGGQMLLGFRSPDMVAELPEMVMKLCYLPLVMWGPLLGVVTISYYRRHRTLVPVSSP